MIEHIEKCSQKWLHFSLCVGHDTNLAGSTPAAVQDPTRITVAPTATSAVVTWEGADGDNWNLRYKVYNPNEKVELLWDFPVDGYKDQVAGWAVYDADEDGL